MISESSIRQRNYWKYATVGLSLFLILQFGFDITGRLSNLIHHKQIVSEMLSIECPQETKNYMIKKGISDKFYRCGIPNSDNDCYSEFETVTSIWATEIPPFCIYVDERSLQSKSSVSKEKEN